MADALSIVVGVGVASFLLFYLSNSFGESDSDLGRQLLKLLAIGFGVILLLLIPKTLMTDTICSPVVANESVNGSTTTYHYTNYCYQDTREDLTGFYKAILWFFRIFVFALLLRTSWQIIQLFLNAAKVRNR